MSGEYIHPISITIMYETNKISDESKLYLILVLEAFIIAMKKTNKGSDTPSNGLLEIRQSPTKHGLPLLK